MFFANHIEGRGSILFSSRGYMELTRLRDVAKINWPYLFSSDYLVRALSYDKQNIMKPIIERITTKQALKTFVKFYTQLYRDTPQAPLPLHFDEVKTLDEKQNPAFAFCEAAYWIARDPQTNKVVGRIAAILNDKEPEQSAGRFGFFDFIDDYEVSAALMQTAEAWLKEKGKQKVHGPLGFMDMDRQGLLIEGFDEYGTMATPYNFEYYKKHLEQMGFAKSVGWVEYSLDLSNDLPPKIGKLAAFAKQRYNFTTAKGRPKKELMKYVPEIFGLVNRTYEDFYGYSQASPEQIKYYGDNYIGFVRKELVCLVFSPENELIGFGVTMPSFTKALQKAKGRLLPFGWWHMLRAMLKNDTLDLYLVAVNPAYRNKGVNAIIIDEIYEGAKAMGVKYAETNIELEENHQVQSMWKYFDTRLHKRRNCYAKKID